MPTYTFKNFKAASRKANMPFFGLVRTTDDTSWIENHWGAPALETPSGTINGANATFTLATTPPNGVMLFNNGLFQYEGVAYAILGATITFQAGYIPQTGDVVRAVVW